MYTSNKSITNHKKPLKQQTGSFIMSSNNEEPEDVIDDNEHTSVNEVYEIKTMPDSYR
jgi:hypothetical protein